MFYFTDMERVYYLTDDQWKTLMDLTDEEFSELGITVNFETKSFVLKQEICRS